MIYAHNLPKALAGCDLLSDDWDKRSCYGGAFMENIVNVTDAASSGAWTRISRTGMHMAGMERP